MAPQRRWSDGLRPRAVLPRFGRTRRLASSLSMLAATLESTTDGILVVDRDGRVVGRNGRFTQLWQLPPDDAAGALEEPLLAMAAQQCRDPEGFRATVAEVYERPDLVADDEVELLDGRVFSRHTRPQLIDGHVVGRVWSFRDRTAERRLESDLRRLAYTDDLTGLPNRALFMDRGRAMAAAAATGDGRLGVAVLDLDHLKDVNDQLGHQAGDEVLRVAALRLRAAARGEDLVARLGGDEFGVLMPHASPATAAAVLQRMADAMSAPVQLCGRTVTSSLSGGSSVGAGAPDGASPGGSTVSLEALLHEADLAMYRAKADGRGRVRAYDADVSRADPRTAAAEVQEILQDPESLTTVLQPICQLSNGLLVGHESLSRFPGRNHREVGEWFALARATGSAPELEARSIEQGRASHDASAGTYLTVNVSPSVLGSDAVQAALSGDLNGLVVEVTEDSRLDLTELARLLDQLRRRGAMVAMDDTGAGYDGLRRLVRLRPEIVKLDRELVHAVHEHPEKRALVEALVSFCRQTGATMCAEGIETADELRCLADLGVHLGQGWLVGRPAAGAPGVTEAAVQACGSVGPTTPGDLDRLRAHLDLAVTVHDVAQAAQRSLAGLQADHLDVALLDGDDLVQVEDSGWTSLQSRYVVADYPATAAVLRGGPPLSVRTDDPDADPAEVRLLRELGFGSLLVLPLVDDGTPTGVIEVYSRAQRTFSDRQVRLGQLLADEVSDALGRVRRGVRATSP